MGVLSVMMMLTMWLLSPLAWAQDQPSDVLAPFRLKAWEGDGRLARRINVSVSGRPLAEAIRQISQRSGVSLRVSRDVAQWRAVIDVQETQLSDVLAGIAFTFDLAWRQIPVKEGEPPAYELFQTPAQKRLQEEFLKARVELAQRMVGEALRRAQWMAAQGVRPPVPIRKEPPRNEEEALEMPTFWLMHDHRLRIVLGKLSPEEWSLLFAGERVILPASRFSTQEAQAVAAPTPPTPREWLAEGAEPEEPAEAGERQLVGVELIYDPFHNRIQAFSDYWRLDRNHTHLREGASLSWWNPVSSPLSMEEAFTVGKLLTSEELRRKDPSPPAHSQETIAERLHRLSRAVRIGVIAEYYPLSMDPNLQEGGGSTAQEILQPLMWEYRPVRSGNLLLFPAVGSARYYHRLCDIPEALLVRWFGDDRRFGFSLQALGEMMMQLSPYQKRALSLWSMFAAQYYATRSPAKVVTLHQFYLGHGGGAELMHLFLSQPEWRRALTGHRIALDPMHPNVVAFLYHLPTWTSYAQEPPPVPPNVALWLRIERQMEQRWAYDALSRSVESSMFVAPDDLCLSKPNEDLRAFQARLRKEHKVEEGRWLHVEREKVTLRFGMGDREMISLPFELTRFTRVR
ncbi:MAG: hypothetical protein KatS3mg023_2439 [Armatimonadota bacterium]|nr:MAG: hypothetical protein KatS3mg023_2439 [Armatimonadota bacterium]